MHAVRAALENKSRKKLRLVLTRNSFSKLEDAVAESGMKAEFSDPKSFSGFIEAGSVHQGAAIEVAPLDFPGISEICACPRSGETVVLLDQVTDPHNVGAILRTAEAFGASALITSHRHSPPETGGLAKSACGSLERVPYLRVPNLARAMDELRDIGYALVGLDSNSHLEIAAVPDLIGEQPTGLVFGSEGKGLRKLSRDKCDAIVKIPLKNSGSLNVSNAAAIVLFAFADNWRIK